MAGNLQQPTISFVFYVSFSPPNLMNMEMKDLMIRVRFLISWLKTYLSLINTITGPVTLMMIPKELFDDKHMGLIVFI